MSSTRRTSENGPLRQERFASSQEFERGLMANLVAKRCAVMDRAEDRELIWFLQWRSHRPGGLKRLTAELRERFADRLATPAMQRLGMKLGQVYNAKQVAQVRAEIPNGEFDFLLQGEDNLAALLDFPNEPDDPVARYTGEWERERETALARLRNDAAKQPASYAASEFVARCHQAARERLERQLGELCLDPALALVDGSPWYFPTLVSTLRELLAEHVNQSRAATQNTFLGQKVCDALDYAQATGKLALVVGRERRGKSHAAKAWCQQHPGTARYLEVPSTNDDVGFFRAIAGSLGVSINLNSKAQELRGRIEETLQSSKLMLVLDESHYVWPQRYYRHSTPARINWLMTALVNHGVPVTLIATPQFFSSQKEIEQRTHWNSGQFTGRIGHYEELPESLSAADLKLVAKAMLPNGDARSIESLADYAQGSKKYLAAIEHAATRALYFANKSGRVQAGFSDVKQAILESVIPSDSALAAALAPVAKQRRPHPLPASATPLQPRFIKPETAIPTSFAGREITPGSSRNRVADLVVVPG